MLCAAIRDAMAAGKADPLLLPPQYPCSLDMVD